MTHESAHDGFLPVQRDAARRRGPVPGGRGPGRRPRPRRRSAEWPAESPASSASPSRSGFFASGLLLMDKLVRDRNPMLFMAVGMAIYLAQVLVAARHPRRRRPGRVARHLGRRVAMLVTVLAWQVGPDASLAPGAGARLRPAGRGPPSRRALRERRAQGTRRERRGPASPACPRSRVAYVSFRAEAALEHASAPGCPAPTVKSPR